MKDTQKIVDKIQKQIESTKKKIEALSGDYQTNTYKRMREKDSRDAKISGYRIDMDILGYLLNKATSDDINQLEISLIIKSFRDYLHTCYLTHKRFIDGSPHAQDVKFPEPSSSCADWYNKEQVPKEQSILKRADIYNTIDLISAVNIYGEILENSHKPVDQTVLKIKKLERECKMMQKGDINFTPSKVATRLVEIAGIQSNDTVLEPSAGIGSVADAIRTATDNIDVVEQMSSFRELLQLKGYNLVGDDFLQYQTDKQYDVIVANPPFSDEQNHVKHMYELLKPGGRLVTITSPHWTFANDKKSVDFRNWVEEQNSYTENLESGTFEMTGVASKILVIDKAS
ncbi:MAG: methyltransferase [Oscillospiraceae bacterium]